MSNMGNYVTIHSRTLCSPCWRCNYAAGKHNYKIVHWKIVNAAIYIRYKRMTCRRWARLIRVSHLFKISTLPLRVEK